MNRKVGDLEIWWVPQIPMDAFSVPVDSVEVGVLLFNTLAAYDLFQFEHKIKPDYCNAGGLRRWCANSDGEGTPGWEDWYDEETGEEDPQTWLLTKADKTQKD